jgi:uncharacterized protein YodC (DUF2158 family)
MFIMEEFEIGNVVRLKSGGPEMTIQRFIGSDKTNFGLKTADEFYKMKGFKEGDLICQWFSDNHVKDGAFLRSSVIKIRD